MHALYARTLAGPFLGAEEPSWKPFLKRRGRVFMWLFSVKVSSSSNEEENEEERVTTRHGGGRTGSSVQA